MKSRRSGPGRRRWPRWVAVIAATLVLAVTAMFAWAWLSVESSTTARAMAWMDADVGDQDRFPARLIPAGDEMSPLPEAAEIDLGPSETGVDGDFDRFLGANDTLAFAVVHRDRLVYERYFGGAGLDTTQTSFSVAKSILSAVIGIAIDEGAIGSVDDPVTEYVPELLERDRRFERITIRDLLAMASGIRYDEPEVPMPLGDDVTTYYGVDLRWAALEDTEILRPAGEEFLYNNFNPLLLGLVLERATGTSVSDYVATRLWQPLGAQADASWSLDSEDSGFEKLESGFNATLRDYARFGLLYLHGGEWNEARIVPEDWVEASTAADTSTDPAPHYQYFWWVDVERPGRFYGLGNLGQYVYVAPDADAVIVRNGADWGVENDRWLEVFRSIADDLE